MYVCMCVYIYIYVYITCAYNSGLSATALSPQRHRSLGGSAGI